MKKFFNNLPALLILAVSSLFFIPLANRALWNSDEGRYAEIAREMLELKDWISPHLNYVLYFEKPPLMYWLTAASMAVFGQNEFAARFWCAGFGVLTVGLVYLLGKLWKDEQTGLWSGIVLATSLLFFALTQFLVVDMALTFWMTLALYASARILKERPPERVRRFTDLLAVAIAGGVLTKGLIALVFPIAILILTLASTRLGAQARKISWQSGLILAVFLAAPWFILVSLRHPFYPYFFFIREHFSRFLTTVHHRSAPFFFFVPVILVGFLPWAVFLPKVVLSAFANRGQVMKRDPVHALLVLWALFIFVFFSFSHSKLVSYILPVFPALALLTGNALEEALAEDVMPKWIEWGLVGLIGVLLTGLLLLKLPQSLGLFKDPVAAVVRLHADGLAVILGLSVFLLVGVWGMRQSLTCLGGIVTVQVLLLSTIISLAVHVEPFLSNKGLARVLNWRARPEERILTYGVSYENVAQTLPFYTKRRITVLGDPGELEMGLSHASDAAEWWTPESSAAEALAKMPVGTWVVTNEEYLKGLKATGANTSLELVSREGLLLLLHKNRE